MEITTRDIFNAIPPRFDASAANGWKATIQFLLAGDKGGEESWCISVADGVCKVIEGKHEKPTATVKTSAKTWIGMTTGTVQPMQAFMSGQLKVEGNIGDVMKLQSPQIFKRTVAKKES